MEQNRMGSLRRPEKMGPGMGGQRKPAPRQGMPVMQQQGYEPEEEHGDAASIEEIADEFMQLRAEGKIPEDLDIQEACQDQAFIELTMELPLEAAIRVYWAEKRLEEAETGARQRVENDMRTRRSLPKSQRSNISVSPSPDYKHMSSEEFRRIEQQYKRAAMAGKKINL